MYLQAKCLKTGPGKHNCTCDEGWRGDGKFCSPRNPCDEHDDCHADAKCVVNAVGQVRNLASLVFLLFPSFLPSLGIPTFS